MAAGRIKGITIEIGGDTTKLTQALSKVDNALGKTKSNLRDLNNALKLNPGNTELLKDRQQELAHAISEAKSKLDTEKEAYRQLAQADQTPENIEKMRQLKVQIDLDTVALEELEKQAKESASILGSQMQAAGEKIQEVGEKIKAVGDKLQTIGRDLTTRVTAPIVAGFAAAVKTTGDFDAAMSKVQAVSGATASDMVILRDKAKEMGETTKFSASESAEALNYMAMAGWKTDQMLGGLEGIMNLAAASGEELGTTSDIVTDALTAFGYKAEQAGRFADILAAASSNSNTNVAMLGESFKYAANPAGALGYSAEDVAVALGLMANAGVKADMAGTSLRNMFQRMAKPTKESAQAMERLGLELYDGEGEMFTFREIMEQLRSGFVNIKMPLDEYDAQVEALDNDLAAGTLTQKKYDAALEELNKQAFGAEGAEKARAAAMLGGSRAMSGLLAI
ncbi:MAG: phage tail tape measure protein, partial [Bacteroidales bacterium]|nr:phage tail tape measure protein [Bacteroidales bacterium]